jgi:hypothetical protein
MQPQSLVNDITHTIYYRLIPKRIRKYYLAFWTSLSILGAGVSLLLVQVAGEYFSVFAIAAFWSLLIIIPVSHITDHENYHRVIRGLNALYETELLPQVEYEQELHLIFSVRNPLMWVLVLMINIGFTIVIVMLGLPFKSTLLNLAALLAFESIVLMGGQSTYTTLAEIVLLHRIASALPPKRFYSDMSVRLRELSTTYYLTSSFHILLVYFAILILVLTGPYAIQPILVLALVVLAALPTIYILVFVFQVHRIMLAFKAKSLEVVDELIRHYSNCLSDSTGTIGDHAERLNHFGMLLDLRDRTKKTKEWPWDIPSGIGLFITSSIGIAQFVLAIWQP